MKVVYFDCPSGASGDMILGALLDAGVSLETLRAELGKLGLPGFTLQAREVRRGAFRATKVDVVAGHRASAHEHRQLRDILAILGGSRARAPRWWRRATRIFTRLAEAEARVHGTRGRGGALPRGGRGGRDRGRDRRRASACTCSAPKAVHVSALPLGGGFVEGRTDGCPVPAPGTAELLRGSRSSTPACRAELVTPTGAAILTTLAAARAGCPR